MAVSSLFTVNWLIIVATVPAVNRYPAAVVIAAGKVTGAVNKAVATPAMARLMARNFVKNGGDFALALFMRLCMLLFFYPPAAGCGWMVTKMVY